MVMVPELWKEGKVGMGLTERHWFEDEEPELTKSQLEDALWENNKIFERGYQKGFSDGRSALFREQERVKPTKNQSLLANFLGWNCGACGFPLLSDGYTYCPRCGRRIDWNA